MDPTTTVTVADPLWLTLISAVGPSAAALIGILLLFKPLLARLMDRVVSAPASAEDTRAIIKECGVKCADDRKVLGDRLTGALRQDEVLTELRRVGDGIQGMSSRFDALSEGIKGLPREIAASTARVVFDRERMLKTIATSSSDPSERDDALAAMRGVQRDPVDARMRALGLAAVGGSGGGGRETP